MTQRSRRGNHLDATDPSIYMLALPKTHPKLRNWCVFAILTGALLALAIVALGNLLF